MFKFLKDSYIITSLLYILMGLILFLYPDKSLKVVCYLFGMIILLFGVIKILGYFRDIRDGFTFPLNLLVGIVFTVVGGFLLLQSELVISILPVVLGVYIVLDSFMNIRQAMDLKKAGYERWKNMLIPAVVMVVLAAVMIFNPFKTMAVTVMFIGGVFLLRGVSNLYSIAFTANRLKKLHRYRQEKGPVDAEAVEVETVVKNHSGNSGE